MFPLLIEKFSFEEQASLVWRFLCSIPINMMVEFLPWLSSSVSTDESQDMRKCLRKIIPNEILLHEVSILTILRTCFPLLNFVFDQLLDEGHYNYITKVVYPV